MSSATPRASATSAADAPRAAATGGVQRVVAKDQGDAKQITLARAHLRKEASQCAAGDFADPMAIHGMNMPGLDTVRFGAARVKVGYSTIPRGGQISYTTTEPRLVAALHEWFDAQPMDRVIGKPEAPGPARN